MKTTASKKYFPLLTGALALALIFAAAPAAKSFAAPGDQSDPLVGMSILDERIDSVNARIDQLFAMIQGGTGAAGVAQPASGAFTPVSASAGQHILGGEGTEIILRSGMASAICPGPNGLSDLTAGTDIFDGMTLDPNHLLIVPRADGRGVKVTADAWFLIRGGYTIG